MTAGALDVITVGEARVAAGYSAGDQSKDVRLQWLVTAVSLKLDELVGPVIQRTVTERHHGGFGQILLRRRPVTSISSIVEYRSGTATTLTAETISAQGDYLAELADDDSGLLSGMVYRRSGFTDTYWPAGRQNIVVTCLAGRFADITAAAGSRFAQAARLSVKANWAGELNGVQNVGEYDVPMASFPTVTIPKAAVDLLADQVQYVGIA